MLTFYLVRARKEAQLGRRHPPCNGTKKQGENEFESLKNGGNFIENVSVSIRTVSIYAGQASSLFIMRGLLSKLWWIQIKIIFVMSIFCTLARSLNSAALSGSIMVVSSVRTGPDGQWAVLLTGQ